MIVIGEHVCEWVAPRTGGSYYAGSGQGIGIEKNGELVAGVLYENYSGNSVVAHIAALPGKRWMTREFLRLIVRYPFDQLKVKKIVAPVDSTNAAALAFNGKLGFVTEAVLKDAGRSGDLHLMTMTRQQCRFLKD